MSYKGYIGITEAWRPVSLVSLRIYVKEQLQFGRKIFYRK
jgi:hypothetical protein